MERAGRTEIRALKAPRDHKVQKVLKAQPARRGALVLKVRKVLKASRDYKVQKVLKEQWAQWAPQARPVHRVIQDRQVPQVQLAQMERRAHLVQPV